MKPAPDFSGTELRRPLVIVSWDRKCVLKKRQLCARKPLLCQIVVLLATFAHGSDSRQALQKAANLFQGKLAEADQEATLALSDPQTRAAACSILLGSIRFQQKRFPESADMFEKAIRLEPHLVGANLSLAEVYIAEGKPQLALPLYRHVLTLDSSNATARLELARAETENGNFQQSLELARPVLSALKNSPDGLFILAIDYLKTKDQDAAVSLASDWLRLSNIPPDLSMKFALVFAREGVASQAIDLLNAIEKRKDHLLTNWPSILLVPINSKSAGRWRLPPMMRLLHSILRRFPRCNRLRVLRSSKDNSSVRSPTG